MAELVPIDKITFGFVHKHFFFWHTTLRTTAGGCDIRAVLTVLQFRAFFVELESMSSWLHDWLLKSQTFLLQQKTAACCLQQCRYGGVVAVPIWWLLSSAAFCSKKSLQPCLFDRRPFFYAMMLFMKKFRHTHLPPPKKVEKRQPNVLSQIHLISKKCWYWVGCGRNPHRLGSGCSSVGRAVASNPTLVVRTPSSAKFHLPIYVPIV